MTETTFPKPDLLPGDGVEVAHKDDPNNGREGFVRERKGPRYQVIFEPGEPDVEYDWFHLRPTGQHIAPESLPPPP